MDLFDAAEATMSVTRRTTEALLIFSGLLVIIALCAVLAAFPPFFIFTSGDIPHRSDRELIANFQSKRDRFDHLLHMIRTDEGLNRVDDNWTAPEDPQAIGISPERIKEYRELFRELGIPRGFSASTSRDRIEFIASTQGLSISGTSKGYTYSKERPKLIIGDLDTYRSHDGTSFTAYRHLDGDWYLYFDFED